MKNYLTAVNVLIAINAFLFFASQSLGGHLLNGMALYFPQNEHFGIWQFVTHMFMHGGMAHLLFNMFALWMFGTQLERMWGKSRFLLFYFLSGVGAALFYTAINYYQFQSFYNETVGLTVKELSAPIYKEAISEIRHIYETPMVGASGAIYGILVAFGVMFPNTKLALIFLPVPIAAKYFIPALLALDLFSGVTGFSIFGGSVAHFAHIGGAIIGFLLMMYWRKTLLRDDYY